jgi:hypothetical protein
MFSKRIPCPQCRSKLKESYDFCPYCGLDIRNPERDERDYGMLGKNETGAPLAGGVGMGAGISDKILNSLVGSLMKALESQMRGVEMSPEVQANGNGITIRVGPAQGKKASQTKKRVVTDEQVKRMTNLPRAEAKTDVRRLSDRVVYEIKAPGITSVEDVFVSKVESGYEVKAIGKNKVYINSLQIDLPLKSYAVTDKGLTVEFGLQ